MIKLQILAALAALLMAIPIGASASAASPDTVWVNPGGGLSGLRVSGEAVVPLIGGDHSLEDIVDGFHTLCAETGFDKLQINPVIQHSQLRGSYMPSIMQMNSGEVDIGGWQGDSHFLGILDHPILSADRQCVFVVSTSVNLPSSALFPVLAARYGNLVNFAAMFNADGKPNDDVRPVWIISENGDMESVLFARNLSRGNEHRIHFALVERPKGGT